MSEHRKAAGGSGWGCLAWLLAVGLACATAQGAWWDGAWSYRRTITVNWNAERAQGTELAQARVYTAGHHQAEGKDVRVATVNGRLVPHEVLFVGPGDRVDVVFALQKGVREYCVYFGNENPTEAPEAVRGVKPTGGLILESRRWNRQMQNNFQGIRAAFERSQPVLGRRVVERPFLGFNPATDEAPVISKLTGTLFVPQDGSYFFALSCDDRGALFIDGEPVVFARAAPGDTRFNNTIELSRGTHTVELYHADFGGDWRISLGWQRPDLANVEVIQKTAFGQIYPATVGPLEHVGKKLVADFAMEYVGECFVGNAYVHRYRFSAVETRGVEYEWEMGDGQKRRGPQVEHVYLRDGVYTVTIRGKSRENEDTQATKLHVGREVHRLDSVRQDDVETVSKVVAGYELGAMSSPDLVRAVQVHRAAEDGEAMIQACAALAGQRRHADAGGALRVLREATREAMERGKGERVVELLRAAPVESNLQPGAAVLAAEYLLWWQGNAEGAMEALRPFQEKHAEARRVYAQALVLAGQAEKGAALLRAVGGAGDGMRAAAMSGAMARTVEYYLSEKDWEAAEAQWREWQARYPVDFLEGYSVWLQVRLMAGRGSAAAAARVAEAFAGAVPGSAYAPRLLHEAAGLVEDAGKREALLKRLKERYPEDPLSR